MAWLPVMTLPDASTIETVLSSADVNDNGVMVHGYRVRHEHGQITEFSTLPEVAAYLHAQFDEATCEALVSDFVTAFSKSRRTASPSSETVPPSAELQHLPSCGHRDTA